MFRRARPVSPEEAFAGQLLAALQREPGVVQSERIGVLALQIGLYRGVSRLLDLRDLYEETRPLSSVDRAARIRTWIRAAVETDDDPTDWHRASLRLLPVLRTVGWQATHRETAIEPLVPFVERALALDHPEFITLVGRTQLASWGVGVEAAGRCALDNLGHLGMQLVPGPVAGALAVLGAPSYVSSWLLHPAAWRDAAAELGGPVIGLAPHRDACCFAPAGKTGIVLRALRWAEDLYRTAPRRLSPVPYEMASDRLERWQPGEGNAAQHAVAKAGRVLAMYEYEQQRSVLGELFARVGEDVHVGSLRTAEQPDGSVLSWATWSKGVGAGLLPVADAIVFVDPDSNESLRVPFDEACAALEGAVERVEGMNPPRVRVRAWPGDRLDALRALGTL